MNDIQKWYDREFPFGM